jgi:hypothetical protein
MISCSKFHIFKKVQYSNLSKHTKYAAHSMAHNIQFMQNLTIIPENLLNLNSKTFNFYSNQFNMVIETCGIPPGPFSSWRKRFSCKEVVSFLVSSPRPVFSPR